MLNIFRLFYGISLNKLRLAKPWPELTIVAEGTNCAEALREYQALEPDVMFLDIYLLVMTGLDVARLMERGRDHARRLHIVFITAFNAHAVQLVTC